MNEDVMCSKCGRMGIIVEGKVEYPYVCGDCKD